MAPRPAVLAAFAVLVVLAGLNFIAVRISNEDLAPTWGAGLRFLVAAILLFTIIAGARIDLPRGQALTGAALYGVFMFALFFGLLYWGLVEVPAPTASVVTATIPLLTFLVAVLMKVERFRWSALAGGAIVVIGAAVLAASASTGGDPWRLAAVFAAAMATAFGTVIVKRFPASHPLATNAIGMGVACVLLIAVAMARGEPLRLPASPRSWAAVTYLVVTSLVLFPLLVWVIRQWTASASAYVMVLAPLVTVPVAVLWIGEPWDARFLWAAVIILAGVYAGALHPKSEGAQR